MKAHADDHLLDRTRQLPMAIFLKRETGLAAYAPWAESTPHHPERGLETGLGNRACQLTLRRFPLMPPSVFYPSVVVFRGE